MKDRRMKVNGFMTSVLAGMIGIFGVIGVLWFVMRDADRAMEESGKISAFLKAQVEERSGRLERYQDPAFFEERGNATLSDRMDQAIPEFDPDDPFGSVLSRTI